MGGDGGVIASNRRYLRGAGTADTAGDPTKQSSKDPALAAEELAREMTTCALTGQSLFQTPQAIVACPYGKLYVKEAAIEALLRRKTQDRDDLGSHIKGLRDLHDARFQTSRNADGTNVPVCPITEKELNGQIPAYLLLPGNPDAVNVVSEKALSEMKALLDDYGPVDRTIRLAPPETLVEELRKEREQKQIHQKNKKRKADRGEDSGAVKKSSVKLAEKTRAKVSAAIQKNEVLSSLFSKS